MDRISKEQRSKNMSAIKSVSQLEETITKELWKRGIRYRRNARSLMGNPDISVKKYKIVIFIDSCFWHCCPEHGSIPKSNAAYWQKKLNRNKKRDEEVNSYYREQGWTILRFWEHEIKQDLDNVIDKITEAIKEAKRIFIQANANSKKPSP